MPHKLNKNRFNKAIIIWRKATYKQLATKKTSNKIKK